MAEGHGKTKRTGSVVGSLASVESKGKPRSFPLWPEFNENDINAEKWDVGSKAKEKNKSASTQFFDDPEGKIELPLSLKVENWCRVQDFISPKIPVVVDNEDFINLMQPNEHLGHSQLMRAIISQVMALWNISRTKPTKPENAEIVPWYPWEHIYSLCKAGKGHMPLFNQFGKYVVRLYWMGLWRKIVVDDLMPLNAHGKLLLPASTSECELWPMLLTKALIKIASIDYNLASNVPELGDFYVIQCLTGWIPEIIPLQVSHNKCVWDLLKKILPEWKLPKDKETEKPLSEIEKGASPVSALSSKAAESNKQETGSGVTRTDHKHEKGSGKDSKANKEIPRKRDEKEKSKSRPHSARPPSARSGADKSVVDEPAPPRPEDIQMVAFATFTQHHSSPAPMSLLRDIAVSSEHLRKTGLSHMLTHPVHISQTRSCSLIPPAPVPEVPRWKLIRPHKKKVPLSDEPIPEPVPPKPDHWLEIISPFIGYRPPVGMTEGTFVSPYPGDSLVLSELDEDREASIKKKVKPSSVKSDTSANQRKIATNSDLFDPQRILSSNTTMKVDSLEIDETNKVEIEEGEGTEHHPEEESDTVVLSTETDVLKKSWVDFDDFCKSFTNIVIFHKPLTYPYNETAGEFKQAVLTAGTVPAPTGGKKGSANQAPSATNIRQSSPMVPKLFEGHPSEERFPGFLFVDSTKETELIISYSVLPRWLGLEDKKTSDKESVAGVSEAVSYKQEPVSVPSGLLVVENYSWKSVVTGQPVLRIRTTGTKAACLTLPAGRHVLRFFYSSPLGYHIHISSATKFVFGDEDTVMAPLQHESCRFIEAAANIMNCLIKSLDTFGKEDEFKTASAELHKAHMPYQVDNKSELTEHYTAWHSAFYSTISAAIGDSVVDGLVFALRAFLLDLHTPSLISSNATGPKDPVDTWSDKIATEEEVKAARLIQRNWRGTYARKVVRCKTLPDSTEQSKTLETLKAVRATLQSNFHVNSLMLLRNFLRNKPSLLARFPFYKDEWNKIAYTDYSGSYSEQPPRTWFVVFRDRFYVEEEVLCVPKIYINIPTCVLRVINNDTGEELKRIFQKVAPHVYQKNKRGYTIVAEAWTLDQPLSAGKWKLRLIGSSNPLPTPLNAQLTSSFATKELKDYYIPKKSHILLSHTLKCNSSMVGSFQLQTSKSEVVVQLKILDNGKELVSVRGKGHCVIPAFYFQTNIKERAASGASNNDTKTGSSNLIPAPSKGVGGKKTMLAKKDGKVSPVAGKEKKHEVEIQPNLDDVIVDDNTYDHNYLIQAVVERKTWPLTRKQWAFVEKLKETEKEEMKALSGGQPQSLSQKPGVTVEKGKRGQKGSTDKGGKEKKQADKEIVSRPSSQNVLDESRAYWSLRFVVDTEMGEEVELKKDTQRIEEIRAMKQAWETAEPGRAVKAMQSRLNYLNSISAKKAESTDKENEEEVEKIGSEVEVSQDDSLLDDTELLFEAPESPKKSLSKPFDFAHYIRSPPDGHSPRYLSAEDLSAIYEKEQQLKTEQHNARRMKFQTFRDMNRMERSVLKEQQLESFKEMQFAMDKARTELLKPREIYRQRLLKEKRDREEEAERKAAAALAALEAASPDGKGKKSGKKKK